MNVTVSATVVVEVGDQTIGLSLDDAYALLERLGKLLPPKPLCVGSPIPLETVYEYQERMNTGTYRVAPETIC